MDGIIKHGKISSVDYKNGCADVVFDGTDGSIKTALPFLSSEYCMPDTGDMVLAVFQQYRDRDEGFIIGKYYNASNMPLDGLAAGDYYKKISGKVSVQYNARQEKLVLQAGSISIDADIKSGTLKLAAKEIVLDGGDISLNGNNIKLDSNSIALNGGKIILDMDKVV